MDAELFACVDELREVIALQRYRSPALIGHEKVGDRVGLHVHKVPLIVIEEQIDRRPCELGGFDSHDLAHDLGLV